MKYHMIAIEREYASGGQEIGDKVAKRLNIPCYGREILEMAAKELKIDMHQLESMEEKASGSIMYSLYMLANLTSQSGMPGENRLFVTESEIIRRITQTPAVIVGRCAVHSLREREDVLRVFVRAEENFREQRAISHYQIPMEYVSEKLRREDRRRDNFYKVSTGKEWKDFTGYDLILDSGMLGIDKCVDILATAYR